MSTGDPQSQGALGFLSVLEHEQLGLVGGYLILNPSGRPLEFHCTAPIKPNRAQQILFGPTLDSYLYGEQIGQTLLAKGSLEPWAVWTNVERAMAVRDYVSVPVAMVLANEADNPGQDCAVGSPEFGWRVDAPHRLSSHLAEFQIGRNRLAVSRESDKTTIAGRLEQLPGFDLSEPFARIREAVEEAHKTSRN